MAGAWCVVLGAGLAASFAVQGAHASDDKATVPAQTAPQPTEQEAKVPDPPAAVTLREEAARLRAYAATADGKRFIFSVAFLPIHEDRTLWISRAKRKVLSDADYTALPEAEREGFEKRVFTDKDLYYFYFGSPLAYARAVDLAAERLTAAPGAGDRALQGKRILDFGYGSPGHLRMLAGMGNDVVGVEINAMLPALFNQPGDQGEVPGAGMGDDNPPGKLTLVHGRWPADAATKEKIGGGYDLIMSKNTLKKGYITPEKETPAWSRVDLGVPPAEYVREVSAALKPGGVFVIYNICGKLDMEQYNPSTDGRSPFTREELEAAGLEVLAFDAEDHAKVRDLGRALGWDTGEQPMDIENGLFGYYTIARKRGGDEAVTRPPVNQ